MDPGKLAALANRTAPREHPDEDIGTEAELEGEPLADEIHEHYTPEELQRLTSPEVGYMELSAEAGGFSCGTCHWARGGHCAHPKVDAEVSPDHGCCNLWAGDGVVFPPDYEPPDAGGAA